MTSDRTWTLGSLALAIIGSVLGFVATRPGGPTADAQSPTGERGSAVLQCYERARKQTLLSDGSAFLLCRGASSNAPARCYETGRKETGLTNRQLFELCRCADSTAPVSCFERANKETFLLDERIIQLCSPVVTENLRLNCQPID